MKACKKCWCKYLQRKQFKVKPIKHSLCACDDDRHGEWFSVHLDHFCIHPVHIIQPSCFHFDWKAKWMQLVVKDCKLLFAACLCMLCRVPFVVLGWTMAMYVGDFTIRLSLIFLANFLSRSICAFLFVWCLIWLLFCVTLRLIWLCVFCLICFLVWIESKTCTICFNLNPCFVSLD